MYCKNCGQKLADGDKFCSSCGTKTPVADNNHAEGFTESVETNTVIDDKPLFEPFDFKAFGFDFANLGLGTGIKKDGADGKIAETENFDWNTSAFPDRNAAPKTEEIEFNWSLSPEEAAPAAEPEIFTAPEPEWTEPASETADLEAELFGNIESKADETRKQAEEIDKFFTFHKKNEEFQKILDREYEKVKSGNIITEEMNAAEAVSEEKFTSRQPEDPMEELFAAEGVIKGYEPKPIETDVLDRIDAIEEEKRIRAEAARLVEEEKAKREVEAVQAAAEAQEITPADTVAPEASEPVSEEQVSEAEQAVEPEKTVAEPEKAAAEPEKAAAEPEAAAEDIPEKTKQVDKAAILAGMAVASEMVERDRAFAAAQETVIPKAEPVVLEEIKFDVPDFLGHQDEEIEEAAAEEQAAPAEEVIEEISVEDVIGEAPVENVIEEVSVEEAVEELKVEEIVEAEPAADQVSDLEFEIFEQLEAQETPAEEIVLQEPQTIEDLFAEIPVEEPAEEAVTEHTVILTEDSVAEILKTVEEDTTKDDTMVFTAHALGALLAEAEQEDPDAKEVVVSLEELTSLEQQAAEGTLTNIVSEEPEEEEEEFKGGKGRTFLKVCLVVLIILLVIEVAGVAIKIAAPTSGAANFIDNQLNKVFQLFSDEDTAPEDYNA